jgi:hypothetical protein
MDWATKTYQEGRKKITAGVEDLLNKVTHEVEAKNTAAAARRQGLPGLSTSFIEEKKEENK